MRSTSTRLASLTWISTVPALLLKLTSSSVTLLPVALPLGSTTVVCAKGSAAVVAAHVVGTTTDEFRRVRDEMTAMLKADGPPPAGERWVDLKYLEPVREYRPRHTSTLLVFDAVCEALDKLEAPRVAAAG